MSMDGKGISLDEFMFRKLQPVRILVGYLNGEMQLNDGEAIELSRMDFDNIISTIEIFIEEYDRVSQHRSTRGSKKKKFTDIGTKGAIKAIA